MKKEIFRKSFIEKLDKNFPKQSKYFEFQLEIFCEFNTIIFEINKCVILELNRATITLTNNLLERLLKLALINNEIGTGSIELEKWNEVFEEPNRKYNSIKLGNSIELCKKFELITQREKDYLFDIVRVLLRNGFSHSDSSEILKNLPDESVMHKGSLINPNAESKEVKINQKIIPTFQALQMEEFAKINAKPYFEFVFELIFKIEKRLIEKNKSI
ncbi:hypothetical protein J2Q11_14105 [Tenacibaculum finnmarkense genomovar finnmarkense]|uniref:hypothetical protein n=1 Tax=Tenacibaculum finnmarkense TaxID=2781243 RepID=UPI001E508D7F|nr:hypothetical protein [Tenacibaculum finnmarkense]MCD8418862.1 hypothetical protein [Tenacibaculum finnmarkense genomovar finnmarkense]MCG8187151.1 hypothetical protein [Tenacibaculum finnmarkense genomovar finnmarkense]MCG8203734.1 hypothetical protein [Tenacibaculum finnmarkense genomovar finnmarkense]MCG8211206.1 hypothetical protein [Tenacibaculum finnmarkense genomovar finnmarkense]MCG8213946.1 hypothetical protein [Tenacibaculum finnmarkense genomovar finnmarkense]